MSGVDSSNGRASQCCCFMGTEVLLHLVRLRAFATGFSLLSIKQTVRGRL